MKNLSSHLMLEVTHGKNGVEELPAMSEGGSLRDFAQVDAEGSFYLTKLLPLGEAIEGRRGQKETKGAGLMDLWEAYDDLVRAGEDS